MSSRQPPDDELTRLLSNVLTETPTVTRSASSERNVPARPIDGRGASGTESTNLQPGNDDGNHQARVNRLTFATASTETQNAGTSFQRNTDSLFIDVTSSGLESSEGGLQMMSARSSGTTSTIASILDVTPIRYDLYRFPLTAAEKNELCCQRQSGGITACVRKNCKYNHRGPKEFFAPGMLAVAKSSAAVFLNPKTNHQFISDEVLNEWQSGPKLLDEWNELFRMVNRQEAHTVITPSRLEGQQTFEDYARDWQPLSSNLDENDRPVFESKTVIFAQLVTSETNFLEAAYEQEKRTLDALDPASTEPTPILKTGEWSYDEAFKRLESSMGINKSVTGKMSGKLDDLTDALDAEMKIMYSRIERTESVMGPRVIPDNPQFNTPTVWGSIGTLAQAIDELNSELLAIKAKNIEHIVSLEHRINKVLEEQLQEIIESTTVIMGEHTEELKESVEKTSQGIRSTNETILLLARGAAKLKEEMADLREAIASLKHVSSSENTHTTDDSTVLSDISTIKGMIRNMGQRLDTVVEGRETKAVKFFGIVFRGHTEAETWVSEHLDGDSFGLVVDAHLVMEHIYHQAFSDDGSLKELNGLYKLKIDNITQGLAMSSFDYQIPRFFSVSANLLNKKPKIRKPDSSHFDNIETYEDWDLPIMGFRAKLKDQLEEFQDMHIRMISETLSPDDPAYRVATMSAQASVSWIQSFVAYLDETYTETFRLPSFTTARAWQLVTQIGRRVLNDVAVPRRGVNKIFKVGNNEKIAQTMFWPMVQSHEVMARYKKANFKDDPSVSNEFMKFMATNSGSTDGLASISTKLSKLETDMKESIKLSKGANTSATNSANKADAMKSLITALTQRVASLEKSNK